ncbi:hypothetical protein CEXT_474391 [Caerostris extrusa]|uniref:Uncharacterized protein n=1 Tax=Caerostris extrusa TaxID=172846 RepID=A0AAV4Q147_CAEEX|nr:hypothetical protein CEXT_474391 [Caerostris extrusa]
MRDVTNNMDECGKDRPLVKNEADVNAWLQPDQYPYAQDVRCKAIHDRHSSFKSSCRVVVLNGFHNHLIYSIRPFGEDSSNSKCMQTANTAGL